MYACSALLALAPGVRAQDLQQAPAHIDFVEGQATVERDGEADQAAPGVPFVAGDRVRTEGGRIEILFPDGAALDLDEYTTLDLQSPTLLRVTSGRIVLTILGSNNPASATRYQIDTPVASANTDGPGEFRVAILSAPSGVQTELAVVRGAGSLTTERGSVAVFAGQRSIARDNDAPMYAQTFNSARFDAFDRWAALRRDARTGTAASSQYLPDSLRLYASSFDRYGAWQYEAPYGYVWYPVVDYSWRPYYDGYWSPIRDYGWTWIGYDVWTWPTHHYGRWGYARNRWFWIPNRYYSAAWVSWGAAPGYVSWCPLGFDNRPVFALSIGGSNWWTGWTVVPRTHFGWYSTPQWAVPGNRLASTTPFLLTTTPKPVTYAIPRSVVADASRPRGVAVPRSGARPQAAASQTTGQPSFVDRTAVPRGGVSVPGADAPRSGYGVPRDSRASTGVAAGTAINRQPPAVDRRFRTADGSTVTIDRSMPDAERRQQADIWLKQPLNNGGGVGTTVRPPDTSRAYQRSPGASTSPVPQSTTPAAGAAPSAVPRWRTYSGAGAASRPAPAPQTVTPGERTSPSPRWQTYSPPGATPRVATPEPQAPPQMRTYTPPARSYSPPQQSAPARSYSPPERSSPPPSYQPAPAYRAPAAAPPHSAPPPAANSGSSEGSASPRSGATGGAGGGARQRHP